MKIVCFKYKGKHVGVGGNYDEIKSSMGSDFKLYYNCYKCGELKASYKASNIGYVEFSEV